MVELNTLAWFLNSNDCRDTLRDIIQILQDSAN